MKLTETELRVAACQMGFIESARNAFCRMGNRSNLFDWASVKHSTLEEFMKGYAASGVRLCFNEQFKYDQLELPTFEQIPALIEYIHDRDMPRHILVSK